MHVYTAFSKSSLTRKPSRCDSPICARSTSNIEGFHHLDNRCLPNSFDGSVFLMVRSGLFWTAKLAVFVCFDCKLL